MGAGRLGPDVDHRERRSLRFIGQLVAEDLTQQGVHDRMEALLAEAVGVFLGLPDAVVAEAALGLLDGEVDDETRRGIVAQAISDPLVERRVDGDVLREREGHQGHLRSNIYPNNLRIDTMANVVKGVKRSYDNQGRRAQSDETRTSILDAARALLVAKGYRATTVARIARDAGVHVDTLYALVGRKPAILRELIELAISGTDRAVAPEERDYVQRMLAEPDPRQQLAFYAAATRTIQARMAPLFLALRDAASTEPEAKAVWQEISERRAANMRRLVGALGGGGLRDGLSVEAAADIVWATASAELYVLMTEERGWSLERYEAFLRDTWHRLLLP